MYKVYAHQSEAHTVYHKYALNHSIYSYSQLRFAIDQRIESCV